MLCRAPTLLDYPCLNNISRACILWASYGRASYRRVCYGRACHGRASYRHMLYVCASHGYTSHGRVSHRRVSYGCVSHGRASHWHVSHEGKSFWACILWAYTLWAGGVILWACSSRAEIAAAFVPRFSHSPSVLVLESPPPSHHPAQAIPHPPPR